MNSTTRMMCSVFVVLCLCFVVCFTNAREVGHPSEVESKPKVERLEELKTVDKIAQQREAEEKARREAIQKSRAKADKQISEVDLPEDTSPRVNVQEIHISGNTLVTTDEILANLPGFYNASDRPIYETESQYLYDFRILQDVILEPGISREVSTRTIKGFTQYLLSVYQKQNYAGIYVRVMPDAIIAGQLKNDILPIEVIEIPLGNARMTFYDIDRSEREEGYLNRSIFEEWSPAKVGSVVNKKKLDGFLNLLNENPDRYVSATVSEGAEPRSIAIGYDIYEIDPWHYFIQIDNAGTDDRQWTPRIGLINTNLTGRDDELTAVAQGPVDNTLEDNYSIYGSYDVPLWTPRLRFKLYGGRSEFDVDGGGGIDFLGNGYFYGGELRFNAFQTNGWFFDILTSLSREKSKVTPSLFPQFFSSEVIMNLWSLGFDLHRRNDISDSSLVFNRVQSIGGSDQKKFWDQVTSTGARTNAERDFVILTLSANHSQFLDADKIQKFLGSFKYIRPDERLVPSKMTTFGGMYSVRGYDESEIVADGGIIASLQYEYDLVRKKEIAEVEFNKYQAEGLRLKKLAPLIFVDYGRADIKDPVAGEKEIEELCSLGAGVIVEIGEHFNAGVYYGHPLRSATGTDTGDGRINVNLMMRW